MKKPISPKMFTRLLTIVIGLYISHVFFLQYKSGQLYYSFLPFQLLFALLTVSIPYVYKKVRYDIRLSIANNISTLLGISHRKANNIIREKLGPYDSVYFPIIAAIVLSIGGMLSTPFFGIPWQGYIRSSFYLWELIFFVGYSLIGWAYFVLMLIANILPSLDIRHSPFSWPLDEVRKIYIIYFQTLLLGFILYMIAVISIWTSPGGVQIAMQVGVGPLWVFPPGALAIVYFLWFHFKTSQILIRCKQRSEQTIEKILIDSFDRWKLKRGESKEQTITNLIRWRKEIREERTWILDIKSVTVTIATILLPTIKSIIDLVT